MAERVQANDVGRAKGTRLGPAQLFAGQIVDNVNRQAKLLRFDKGRQDTEDPDPIGNEVGRVLGANTAFAHRSGQKTFEFVQNRWRRADGGNQLHQVHIARRIKKMHAAKTRRHVAAGKALGQLVDRQAGGIGRKNRIRCDERRDLAVQVVLPIHPLSYRLNDQIAVAQTFKVLFVIGGGDKASQVLTAQRRRTEFFQPLDGFENNAVLRPFFGRQVVQHHIDPGVD